jgi:hypothetical protein
MILVLMSEPKWMHTAQRGFFSHDEDPESWDFRATTQPNLGLIPRAYPTDNDFDPSGERSAWERFEHYLRYLNLESPTNRCYKLFYLVRHGEGVHNVKEKEVGREEWNVGIQCLYQKIGDNKGQKLTQK